MSAVNRRQLLQGAAALGVTAALATETGLAPAAQAHDTGPVAGTLGEPEPLDGRPFPAYDYTRANKLPREMTGYWTKSFDVDGRSRARSPRACPTGDAPTMPSVSAPATGPSAPSSGSGAIPAAG
jgi:hypothetical protein